MSISNDDNEMFAFALVVCEEGEKRNCMWVHPVNQKRETYGEFHHLFVDLLKDKVKDFQYFECQLRNFIRFMRFQAH